MLIKLKKNVREAYLNKHKVYKVLGIFDNSYRIINEKGTPAIYNILLFDIINGNMEFDCVVEVFNKNIYIIPKELECFSYESFFDGDKKSLNIFLKFLKKQNIAMVSNLAYAPDIRKKYYDKLLEKIEKHF